MVKGSKYLQQAEYLHKKIDMNINNYGTITRHVHINLLPWKRGEGSSQARILSRTGMVKCAELFQIKIRVSQKFSYLMQWITHERAYPAIHLPGNGIYRVLLHKCQIVLWPVGICQVGCSDLNWCQDLLGALYDLTNLVMESARLYFMISPNNIIGQVVLYDLYDLYW